MNKAVLSGGGDSSAGGFIENPDSATPRAPLNAATVAGFLPALGEFVFPEPYNTTGIRLTNSEANYSGDAVQAVGYSYWLHINNHVGSDEMKTLVGLPGADGGASIITYNKVTGALSSPEPIWDSPFDFSTEQFYFSRTDPNMLYFPYEEDLYRLDIQSLPTSEQVVFNTASIGSGIKIKQAHSSDDNTKHSFTYMNSSYVELGAAKYDETDDSFELFPHGGDDENYDEAQIDRGGEWLLIKEHVGGAVFEDNRIVDLSDSSERVILDTDGSGGHSDSGFGAFVANDRYGANANTYRLWNFNDDPLSGLIVYEGGDWNSFAPSHVSWTNSRADIPIADQYFGGSSANDATELYANEIICVKLDGSKDVLVVAPVMTTLASAGGGSTYYKRPKGHLDVTGEYFLWSSNMGTDRLDLFMAKVPNQLLDADHPHLPAVNYRLTVGQFSQSGGDYYGFSGGDLGAAFGAISPSTLSGGLIDGLVLVFVSSTGQRVWQASVSDSLDVTGKKLVVFCLGVEYDLLFGGAVGGYNLFQSGPITDPNVQNVLVSKAGDYIALGLRVENV